MYINCSFWYVICISLLQLPYVPTLRRSSTTRLGALLHLMFVGPIQISPLSVPLGCSRGIPWQSGLVARRRSTLFPCLYLCLFLFCLLCPHRCRLCLCLCSGQVSGRSSHCWVSPHIAPRDSGQCPPTTLSKSPCNRCAPADLGFSSPTSVALVSA